MDMLHGHDECGLEPTYDTSQGLLTIVSGSFSWVLLDKTE